MDFFAEAMAYGEEREFREHEKFNRFVRKQRAIWTPRHVFNKCCVKWLVYGKDDSYYDRDEIEDQWNDGNVVGRGCDYCEKEHPRIQLSYDPELNVTVVKLSHLLDPFVSCMEALVADGSGRKVSADKYHLDGYLRENVKKMMKYAKFGKHLVSFKRKDLELSDKAQKDTSGTKRALESSDDKAKEATSPPKKARKNEEGKKEEKKEGDAAPAKLQQT